MKPNKIKWEEEFERNFGVIDRAMLHYYCVPVAKPLSYVKAIKQFISKAIDKAYKEGLSKGFDEGRDFEAKNK